MGPASVLWNFFFSCNHTKTKCCQTSRNQQGSKNQCVSSFAGGAPETIVAATDQSVSIGELHSHLHRSLNARSTDRSHKPIILGVSAFMQFPCPAFCQHSLLLLSWRHLTHTALDSHLHCPAATQLLFPVFALLLISLPLMFPYILCHLGSGCLCRTIMT